MYTAYMQYTHGEKFELFRVRQAGTYPSMHRAKCRETSTTPISSDQPVFGLREETQVLLCMKLYKALEKV